MIAMQTERRHVQLERIFAVLDVIAGKRFGISIERLHEFMRQQFGTCARTTRRDVLFLESVGLIRRLDLSYGADVYVFNADSPRALSRQLANRWQESQSVPNRDR